MLPKKRKAFAHNEQKLPKKRVIENLKAKFAIEGTEPVTMTETNILMTSKKDFDAFIKQWRWQIEVQVRRECEKKYAAERAERKLAAEKAAAEAKKAADAKELIQLLLHRCDICLKDVEKLFCANVCERCCTAMFNNLRWDRIREHGRQMTNGCFCTSCKRRVPDTCLEFMYFDHARHPRGSGDLNRMSKAGLAEELKKGRFVCGQCFAREVLQPRTNKALSDSTTPVSTSVSKLRFAQMNRRKLAIGQCADCAFQFQKDVLDFAHFDNLTDRNVRQLGTFQCAENLDLYMRSCDLVCRYCWKERCLLRTELGREKPGAMEMWKQFLRVKEMLGYHTIVFGDQIIVPNLGLATATSMPEREVDQITNGKESWFFRHVKPCSGPLCFSTKSIRCGDCNKFTKHKLPTWLQETSVRELRLIPLGVATKEMAEAAHANIEDDVKSEFPS